MTYSQVVHNFLTSGVFTMLVEAATLGVIVTLVWKQLRVRLKDALFVGAFASFATIPYVWFIFPYFFGRTAVWYSGPFAVVVEAVFLRWTLKLDWRAGFVLSLAANTASFVLGNALRSMGLWFYW